MKIQLVEIEMGVLLEVECEKVLTVGMKVTGYTCAGWYRNKQSGVVKAVY